jgi:tripartite-type tricarboxylate transporter receptor subunit TctC
MRTSRRLCQVALIAVMVSLCVPAAAQDKYPSKPVEIIVAWAAGGATDVLFRAIGAAFPKYANGQQLIVKNIPGGGAAIGYAEAMKAKGDGYTIVASATPMVTKIHMSKVPFTATTFAPVIMLADNSCMVMVPADSPFKDLKEFVEAARKRPGEVTIGNAGSGGGYHMVALAFQSFTKAKFNHIPFEGGGPAITAALGKHVDSIIVSAPEGVPQALAGQLRVLGIFGPDRLDKFPKVPTAKEQGMDFAMTMWRGVIAPKDTPPAILKQMHDILKKSMDDPEFKKKADELSVELRYMDAEAFGKFMVSEDARYKELIMAEKMGDRYK